MGDYARHLYRMSVSFELSGPGNVAHASSATYMLHAEVCSPAALRQGQHGSLPKASVSCSVDVIVWTKWFMAEPGLDLKRCYNDSSGEMFPGEPKKLKTMTDRDLNFFAPASIQPITPSYNQFHENGGQEIQFGDILYNSPSSNHEESPHLSPKSTLGDMQVLDSTADLPDGSQPTITSAELSVCMDSRQPLFFEDAFPDNGHGHLDFNIMPQSFHPDAASLHQQLIQNQRAFPPPHMEMQRQSGPDPAVGVLDLPDDLPTAYPYSLPATSVPRNQEPRPRQPPELTCTHQADSDVPPFIL